MCGLRNNGRQIYETKRYAVVAKVVIFVIIIGIKVGAVVWGLDSNQPMAWSGGRGDIH